MKAQENQDDKTNYMNFYATEEMKKKLLKDSQRQESVSKFLADLSHGNVNTAVFGIIMLAIGLGLLLAVVCIIVSISTMGATLIPTIISLCVIGAVLTTGGGALVGCNMDSGPSTRQVASEIKEEVSVLIECLYVKPDAIALFNAKNHVNLNEEQYENFISNTLLLEAFIGKTLKIESSSSHEIHLLAKNSLNDFFAKQDASVKVFIDAASSKNFTSGKDSAFKKYAELFADHALKSHKMMKEVVEENTAGKQDIDKTKLFRDFVDTVITSHYHHNDPLMQQLTTAYAVKKQNSNLSYTVSEGSYKFSNATLKAINELANGSAERYAKQFYGSENMYNYNSR